MTTDFKDGSRRKDKSQRWVVCICLSWLPATYQHHNHKCNI